MIRQLERSQRFQEICIEYCSCSVCMSTHRCLTDTYMWYEMRPLTVCTAFCCGNMMRKLSASDKTKCRLKQHFVSVQGNCLLTNNMKSAQASQLALRGGF